MEQDETPNNVYALFPGIDTAPFGVAETEERVPPLQADEGWSAVPERSITVGHGDEDDLGEPLPSRRVSLERRSWVPASRPFLWVAAALAAGAAIAAGQAVVDQRSAAPHQRSAVASVAPLERHVLAWPKRASVVAHHRPAGARHGSRSEPPHHTIVRSVGASDVTAGSASQATSAPATPVEPQPPAAAYDSGSSGGAGSGGTGTARQAGAHHQRSNQPAGPTGPVSLVGAGTTPSG